MPFDMNHEQFLEKARCSKEEWEATRLKWTDFEAIAKDHEHASKTLSLHGAAIATRLQAFEGVHSVRWRTKDTYGLLKKILRKNLETPVKHKWISVTSDNYREIVSDLIGVRALHLLKEDCILIDEQIRSTWNITDSSIFIREGDTAITEIIDRGATEEKHDAGYRSIHYSLIYHPEKKPILVEIQVRTIFQEGWSEIDHKVRYPDYSDNEMLTYFLGVFNGLSGTADDMGSFVMTLDQLIRTTGAAILQGEAALAERDSDIESMQQELNKLKEEGSASKSIIDSLQNSVNNIKDKNTETSKTNDRTHAPDRNFSDAFSRIRVGITDEQRKTISDLITPNSSRLSRLLANINPSMENFSAAAAAAAGLRASMVPNLNNLHDITSVLNPHSEHLKPIPKRPPPIEPLKTIVSDIKPIETNFTIGSASNNSKDKAKGKTRKKTTKADESSPEKDNKET